MSLIGSNFGRLVVVNGFKYVIEPAMDLKSELKSIKLTDKFERELHD